MATATTPSRRGALTSSGVVFQGVTWDDYVKQGRTADSTEWIRSFRTFVREKVVPRP
jgi:hypothetical protein